MLQQGSYDVLEFTLPTNGMNQNISPDILPGAFAYTLENILSKPLGEGQIRYGTSLIMALDNPEAVIIKQFPFIKAGGSEQIVLYVQEYQTDETAADFKQSMDNPYSFTFKTDNGTRFIEDTPIKVVYQLNGIQTLYDTIASFTFLEEGSYKVTLSENSLPPLEEDATIKGVSYSVASIYVYDLQTKALTGALRENLSVGCIPRAVTFLNTLVLCNGVDPLLSYDGTNIEEVYDFVKEEVSHLSRDDEQELSFKASDSFNPNHYQPGRLIQLSIQGIPFKTTITKLIPQGSQMYVLEVKDTLPPFIPNKTFLFYQAYPPAFNFLYVAYNRLWALGPGACGLAPRVPGESMKVYFAYRPNSITGWFDEKTQSVPSLDLSKTHGLPDNLEAIDVVGSYLIFLARENTQVWQGTQPNGAITDPLEPPLVYKSTLNIGIPHGDLVLDLPNDVYVITKTGLQSASSFNIAQQFAASSLNAVDPLIKQFVTSLLSSNSHYRRSCAFKYLGGPFAGFKIGPHKALVSLLSTDLSSWSLFSGDFLKASSFLSLGDCLYLSIANKVYLYADSSRPDSSLPCYGDQGGEGLIAFRWTLPVISHPKKRYANKRYEVQMDYPSSFTLKRENTLNENRLAISIAYDLPQTDSLTTKTRLEERGDRLQTIPLTIEDPATADSIGFRLAQPYQILKDRLKFLASRFWVTLQGETNVGPVSLKRLKLYGIWERS